MLDGSGGCSGLGGGVQTEDPWPDLVEITPRSSARLVFDSLSDPAIISSSRASCWVRTLASRSAASGLRAMGNVALSVHTISQREIFPCDTSSQVPRHPLSLPRTFRLTRSAALTGAPAEILRRRGLGWLNATVPFKAPDRCPVWPARATVGLMRTKAMADAGRRWKAMSHVGRRCWRAAVEVPAGAHGSLDQ